MDSCSSQAHLDVLLQSRDLLGSLLAGRGGLLNEGLAGRDSALGVLDALREERLRFELLRSSFCQLHALTKPAMNFDSFWMDFSVYFLQIIIDL